MFQEIISEKINFDINQISDLNYTELDKLKNELYALNMSDIIEYYVFKHQKILKVNKLNAKEEENTRNFLKTLENNEKLLGKFYNGWILGSQGMHFYFGNKHDFTMSYYDLANTEWVKANSFFSTTCSFKNNYGLYVGVECDAMESFKSFFKNLVKLYEKFSAEINKLVEDIDNKKNIILSKKKSSVLDNFDKDKNGVIDIIEGGDDFMTLLKKHQKKVIEVDMTYVQHFVKVSNYLKTKRKNIQSIFNTIGKSSDQKELNENVKYLKNKIHTYNLLIVHSLNMITSLVNNDMITFYEIYESFDKLNIFNSNWENEVSDKLSNIEDGLKELLVAINRMERNIVSELLNIGYITEGLTQSVNHELNSINSSIKFNNLLTAVQTYKMFQLT